MEFKRSRSDSVTSAGSNGSAQRRGVTLDHHSMNAHRRPLEEFLTALRKVCFQLSFLLTRSMLFQAAGLLSLKCKLQLKQCTMFCTDQSIMFCTHVKA